jgi:hypothetical protein
LSRVFLYLSFTVKRLTYLLFPLSVLALACADSPRLQPQPDGDDPAQDPNNGGGAGGTSGNGGAGTGAGTVDPPDPTYVKTITGDATWTVTFDDDAKANGSFDCLYTRHYEGVEDRSAPWKCPQCEIMFRNDVVMTVGKDDCYPQVTSAAPAPEEWLGYGNGVWYRGRRGALTEQGTAVVDSVDVTWNNLVEDLELLSGGTMQFDVAGTVTMGEAEGDPLNGFEVPDSYTCGWPKADPPAYDGNYQLVLGEKVPDGFLKDNCDETVRLHDFMGGYLIIDMSAVDCPPCQTMASNEEQFTEDMAAQGIEAYVITLLAPSLADTTGETTTEILNIWINNFGLSSPVLADRAWGLSIFPPAIEGAGYPSWVLVAPDLTVMDFASGYGGFANWEAAIVAHATAP